MYINFIGTDGSGKDTIFDLVKDLFPGALHTREPGGTSEAELIRDVILNNSMSDKERYDKLSHILTLNINQNTYDLIQNAKQTINNTGISDAEPYLYAASRSESIEKSIKPALSSNITVLGRRSVACSIAYQGNARGKGMTEIWDLNYPIVKDSLPSLEIFFDLPIDVAMGRLSGRTEKQDRLDRENREFFEKVRSGYLYYYQNICPYPYVIVDATDTIENVHKETLNVLRKHNTIE